MIIIIHGIIVIVDKIPSINIIDVAISVIIYTIARYFTGVDPDIGGEILMGIVNTCIDHSYDDGKASCIDIPCFDSINIRIRRSSCLSGIMQAMEQRKIRIIGHVFDMHKIVGLSVFNIRILIELSYDVL